MSEKKYCLAIETTGSRLGLALARFERDSKTWNVCAFTFQEASRKQADEIVPRLEKMLHKVGIEQVDIGLVCVDTGPGSFTGVRVGVAAARALGQALAIPVVGILCLEAFAFEARKSSPSLLVATRPALSNELYAAVYAFDEKRYAAGGVGLVEKLAPSWLPEAGFRASLRKLHAPLVQPVERSPHPKTLLEMGLRRYFERPDPTAWNYAAIQPVYLQPCWAERRTGPSFKAR